MRKFADEYDDISSIDSAESICPTRWGDRGFNLDGKFCFYAFKSPTAVGESLSYCYPVCHRMAFDQVQYLYFKFLDQGVLMQLMNETAQVLLPVYKAQGLQETDIREAISMFGSLTPIQLTFMFMMQNIFIGLLLSLPIAAVCTRKNRYGGQKIK